MTPMSLLRKSKARKTGSTWKRLRDRLFGDARGLNERKNRRLAIDPLEERTLLTVSVGNISAILVANSGQNATIGSSMMSSSSFMSGSTVASATDKDGDTIVAWAQSDNGDSNIYARYLTNEVQQISLPAEVLNNAIKNKLGTVSLTFGGNEVQQLKISTATISGPDASSERAPVTGTFKLSYRGWDPAKSDWNDFTTDAIEFDESQFETIKVSTTLASQIRITDGVGADLNRYVSIADIGWSNAYSFGYGNNAVMQIGDEQILVSYVGTDYVYIEQRGYNNTTIAEHNPDAAVTITSQSSAANIEAALHKLAADNSSVPDLAVLADVVVTATDSQTYQIAFGANSTGLNPRQLSVSSKSGDTVWNTGWLPAATMSTVSEPVTITFKVSPNNPAMTKLSIEDAFKNLAQSYYIGETDNDNGPGSDMPSSTPKYFYGSLPEVSVTPLSLTEFQIEFVGTTALTNVPTLEVSSIRDASGNVVDPSGATVKTLKESSDVFRVNPEEIDNPYTQGSDTYDQTDPAVAIDSDGDFVIVWQSEVPDSQNHGAKTDIFGRLYTTTGIVDASDSGIMTVDMNFDGVRETKIQGVRPVEVVDYYSAKLSSTDPTRVEDDVYTFRANVLTTNVQQYPTVAMDAHGNFAISWEGEGQLGGYYNDVYVRQFSADGAALTSVERQVNTTTTGTYMDSRMAMSDDGHFLVTWFTNLSIWAELYAPDGTVLKDEWLVAQGSPGHGCYDSSAAFDTNNNFAISWTHMDVDPDSCGVASTGVYFTQYDITGAVTRPRTRANSAQTPDGTPCWPGMQYDSHVILDSDGDLTVTYSGYGPDVAETAQLSSFYFRDQMDLPENADLITAWPALQYLSLPYGGFNSGDIDSEIEEILATAQKDHGFSDEQLGRLNAILNSIGTLLRGEANGIFFTQYDTNRPDDGDPLSTDNVVNSQRDGVNTRVVIEIPKDTATGSFTIRLNSPTAGIINRDFAFAPVFTNEVFDVEETRKALDAAIEAQLGVYWPEGGPFYDEGCCIVRTIWTDEIALKKDTYWDMHADGDKNFVYEVTFVGEAHDSPIYLNVQANALKNKVPADVFPSISTLCYGYAGTLQSDATVGMTAEGNFVVTYLQYNEDGDRNDSSQSIYVRTFNEDTNTAGPTVTSVATGEGNNLVSGSTVAVNDAVNYLVVTVSEKMYSDLTGMGNDVTNKDNYVLYDSTGRAIKNGINRVYYGLSEAATLAAQGVSGLNATPTGKYEIVIAVDANGVGAGTTALSSGTYTLKLLTPVKATNTNPVGRSGLTDLGSCGLGATGYTTTKDGSSIVNSGEDYSLTFSITVASDTGTPKQGTEIRANEYTPGVQTTTSTMEAEVQMNNRCVAADDDGDYVVVWISEGSQDGDDAGVYMRLYNADGNPSAVSPHAQQVNSFTTGNQTSCAVAMDADGDFVVVWASQDQDGSGYGIYAQRYNAVGTKVGGEFRVNTNTIGDQVDPSVAMDSFGNFVVTWVSTRKVGSNFNNTIQAQAYDADGVKTSEEFTVNQATMSNVTEAHPQVALNDAGYMTVVWSTPTLITNGVLLDTMVVARLFTTKGVAATNEFVVDLTGFGGSTGRRSATNATVAMNRHSGTIVIAWQGYGLQDYDIYYSVYDINRGIVPEDADEDTWVVGAGNANNIYLTWRALWDQANVSISDSTSNNYDLYSGDQINPSVAINANDEFVITWNGNGTEADAVTPTDLTTATGGDTQGVWIRSFDNHGVATSTEERVNLTSIGYQGLSSVAMTTAGDCVVAWYGRGAGDLQGVYSYIHDETSDTAGPMATDLSAADGSRISSQVPLAVAPTKLIVSFDENLPVADADDLAAALAARDAARNNSQPVPSWVWTILDSVNNPENWQLVVNGMARPDAITGISFQLNPATHKYEATLTLKSNLPTGTYSLTALHPLLTTKGAQTRSGIRDMSHNAMGLDSSTAATNGKDSVAFKFSVARSTVDEAVPGATATDGRTYAESARAVTVDGDGDHVVVWTAGDPISGVDRVYVRLYKADGSASTTAFAVDSGASQPQRYATVACDGDGDFIVTWTQYDSDTDANVYGRRFDSMGVAQGDAFRINSYTADNQLWSKVAMNTQGEFVVTWTSLGQEDNGQMGMGYGVYARRYDSNGAPLGTEFQVNVTTSGNQQNSSVALGDNGSFVVTWQSSQNGVSSDIIARVFNSDGSPQMGPLQGETLVNEITSGDQRYPEVSIDLAGRKFVVVWQSSSEDGSGWGVFSRMFDIVMPTEKTFTKTDGRNIPNTVSDFQSRLTIDDSIRIADINVHLSLITPNPSDMTIWLTSPNAANPNAQPSDPDFEGVILCSRVPRPGNGGAIPTGGNFLGTIFDDSATTSIDNSLAATNPAIPPFSGTFRPELPLSTFNDQVAKGTWILHIRDSVPQTGSVDQYLLSWGLDILPASVYPVVQVNTSTAGDQLYPSVAMASNGTYVVAWSGNGSQTNQSDSSGVFYQRFDQLGQMIGNETRANGTTVGNQGIASIGSDAQGNVVMVWTGPGTAMGTTSVYKYRDLVATQTVGPVVTDVHAAKANGSLSRVQDGGVVLLSDAMNRLVVSFDSKLNSVPSDASPLLYAHSVLNPANWSLYRDGSDITGAITVESFTLNPLTNKWEAVLKLDGNGISGGTAALASGSYTLVASDEIWGANYYYDTTADTYAGYKLDGDFDGVPGTDPNYSATRLKSYASHTGFSIDFSVTTTAQFGPEYRVNQNTNNDQLFSDLNGTGFAREQTARSMAADHSGNFVVVWTSYSMVDGKVQADVYMRLYDRNNNALTPETLVNTGLTAGDQNQATVAMDADGDFVVVWQSEEVRTGTPAPGDVVYHDIYAQRFNSNGKEIGKNFRVNTTFNGNQTTPAVAMNSYGNFAVVWATAGQTLSYFNDVKGQLYNADGGKVGSEFLVNTSNIPGTGGTEVKPSVAMNDTGDFVVTWDQATGQVNGIVVNTNVMARMYDKNGTPKNLVVGEGDTKDTASNLPFQVNVGDSDFTSDAQHSPKEASQGGTDTRRNARNSQIVMDGAGGFIVVWESFQDNDVDPSAGPDSYGIYFRRFNADGTAKTAGDQQANFVLTDARDDEGRAAGSAQTNAAYARFAGNQVNPTIAMDADGDFVISWDGNGAAPSQLDPANPLTQSDADTQGIWIRRFNAGDGMPVSQQTRVNATTAGYQKFPSVAMTPDGDVVAVWQGNGVGDQTGIYFRRYNEPTDTAGPMVTGFALPNNKSIGGAVQVTQSLQAIVVTFDEEMLDNPEHTGSAVTNPANYQLLKDGVNILGGISQVYYGLDMANQLGSQYGLNVPKLNKYQAVLIVDANGASPGVLPLADGQYQIVALKSLRDKANNQLRSTALLPNGGIASGTINITVPTGQETLVPNSTDPKGGKYTTASTADAVAADGNGDYVVAWTDTAAGHEGVWVKMYQQTSTLNTDSTRTTTVTEVKEIQVSANTEVSDVAVARDTDGDFVVTWSAKDPTTNWDIFAQRFDATGAKVGGTFRVNSTTADVQQCSSVSMDAEGDFVITWQSQDQDGSGFGVYAQAYNASGSPVGGVSEIQAIDFSGGFTGTFRLRWDDDNNPATPDKVTAPISFTGNAASAVAGIKSALAAIGAEVNVVASNASRIVIQFVGVSGNADRQPLWISADDVVKTGGTSVAQVTTKTLTDGKTGEVRVNDTTAGDQMLPDVAMDASGDYIITWTSFGQGNDVGGESNVYAKRYSSSSLTWNADNIDANALNLVLGGTPHVDTVDDPSNHIVEPSDGFTGVVEVIGNDYGSTFLGSGSLLAGTDWVLTAGHVCWSMTVGAPLTPDAMFVIFDLPAGKVMVPVTQVVVNPGFAGSNAFLMGSDIALMKLAYVPTGAIGLPIYTGSDEVGQVETVIGYGAYGTGTAGAIFDPDEQKRSGKNIFDATGATLGFSDQQLVVDFDDGTAAHDAFGVFYGIHNTDSALVAANEEAVSCHGDSGGPALIDGKIAGIVSGGTILSRPPADIDSNPDDSSFGEFDIYTRVSSFADWIKSVTNVQGQGEFIVNQNDIVNVVTDNEGKPVTDNLGNLIYMALDNESGSQGYSSVACDTNGDFVITWTSYGHDGGIDTGNGSNGVFARRYNANVTPASNVIQVNQTTADDQQNSKVSMDDAGNFVITWENESNGQVDVYARRYASTDLVKYAQNLTDPLTPFLWSGTNQLYAQDSLTVAGVVVSSTGLAIPSNLTNYLTVNNGAIGGEFRVNSTTNGDQSHPSVAMDATGDIVVVWSGNGEGAGQDDTQGVFYQRLARPKDTAGPTVADVLNVHGTTVDRVRESTTIGSQPTQFVLTFSEPLSTQNGTVGSTSILNPSNWKLTKNGAAISGGVNKVLYGLNQAYLSGLASQPSNKYEAVVTFDGNAATAGNQALGAGSYQLSILSTVTDIFGNKFDGAYTGLPGSDFTRSFTVAIAGDGGDGGDGGDVTPPGNPGTGTDDRVNTYNTGEDQPSPVVAADASGNYVVAWVTKHYGEGSAADIADKKTDGGDVVFQRFDKYGTAIGAETLVTTRTRIVDDSPYGVYVSNGTQGEAAIAMDAYGDFVIVWSGEGTSDDSGVFAQVYDRTGKAFGSRIRINQSVLGVQNMPSVAMDSDGNFVVTWTSFADGADSNGAIYARRYNIVGTALSDQFLVNTTIMNRQDSPDVAMDSDGDFVIVWQSDLQDGNMGGCFGQRYTSTGAKAGSEFQINTYTLDKQIEPKVAMDANGEFVVTWASFGQDGSGWGVYARRYSASGVAKTSSEFQVNKTAINWQVTPDVDMADNGAFVISWSAFGQDNTTVAKPTNDYGIYARVFNADGTDYKNATSGAAIGEFRMNKTTLGDQMAPSVAMSGNRIVTVWTGPVVTGTTTVAGQDIYSRLIALGTEKASTVPAVSQGPVIGGVVASTSQGVITWNATASQGLKSAALWIDNVAVSKITGTAVSDGSNYLASMGVLKVGTHSYVIKSTDKAGHVTTLKGSFTVTKAGPTITTSGVNTAKGTLTCNVAGAQGVSSVKIWIDNKTSLKVNGPYATTIGAYYTSTIGKLTAGKHSFLIKATDKNGHVSSFTGSFSVAGAAVKPAATTSTTSTGPVIRSSGVSTKGVLSCSVSSSKAVKTVRMWIDSKTELKVSGPLGSSGNVNFSGTISALAAGKHTYQINVTDSAGKLATLKGTFVLTKALGSNVARSAVFSAASSSAKVDWVYDLNALAGAQTSTTKKSSSTNAVDAVLAAY